MSVNTPVASRNHFSPQKTWQLLRRGTRSRMGGMEPQQPQGPESPLQDRTASGRNPAARSQHRAPCRPHTTLPISTHTARLRGVGCHLHIPRGRPPEGPAPPMTDVQAMSAGNKLIKKQEGPCPAAQGQSAPWTRVPMTHPVGKAPCAPCEASRLSALASLHGP